MFSYTPRDICRPLTSFIQQLEGIPEAYRDLRDMVLDLVKELNQAREERKQFDTSVARRALDDLIELTSEIAEEVSRCYSRSKVGK